MEKFDVIIIGGGPTGSTSAALLAQKGLKVLLLEKEKFPREHVGESLVPLSYELLKSQGLLDDMEKIATRKPGVTFVNKDGNKQSLWCFKSVLKDESYLSFHVIRSAFDKLLLDNGRKKGADVREMHTVKNVNLDRADKIVEVEAMDAKGNKVEFESRFIIDASGQSTFLGRKLGVKKSYADLDRVAVFTHWKNCNFDLHLREGAIKIVYLGGEKKGWMWVIPVSKDHLSIGVVVNNAYVKQRKSELKDSAEWKEDFYLGELQESYLFDSILKDATREHKVGFAGDYSYYCEKKYGDNFVLLGDAGAFLDPIFSSGIYVGMHSAELVAPAIADKLNGNGDKMMEEAFVEINGAVKLLEKFIRLFYTPEAADFSNMGNPSDMLSFEKFENDYTMFHYLLAGDFFRNHQKYMDFIDLVQDQKSMNKFNNLIAHPRNEGEGTSCGENFEEMYGKMTHQIEFDHSAFM